MENYQNSSPETVKTPQKAIIGAEGKGKGSEKLSCFGQPNGWWGHPEIGDREQG